MKFLLPLLVLLQSLGFYFFKSPTGTHLKSLLLLWYPWEEGKNLLILYFDPIFLMLGLLLSQAGVLWNRFRASRMIYYVLSLFFFLETLAELMMVPAGFFLLSPVAPLAAALRGKGQKNIFKAGVALAFMAQGWGSIPATIATLAALLFLLAPFPRRHGFYSLGFLFLPLYLGLWEISTLVLKTLSLGPAAGATEALYRSVLWAGPFILISSALKKLSLRDSETEEEFPRSLTPLSAVWSASEINRSLILIKEIDI